MTLLSISRPRAMRTPTTQNEYGEFVNSYARAMNGYAKDCSYSPAVNIVEQAKNFVITMAAPGYSKKDFSINIDKDVLTVTATVDNESDKINYLVNEFSKCSFERRFNLGKSIDTSKIDATYKEGILEITLNKREEAIQKPARTISVS